MKDENRKRKIIDEISDENSSKETLREILKDEPEEVLGDDFTRRVMNKIEAVKKPSPIIKLARITVPVAACAAMVVICFTIGFRNLDTITSAPEGIIAENPSNFDAAEIPEESLGDPEKSWDDVLKEESEDVADSIEKNNAVIAEQPDGEGYHVPTTDPAASQITGEGQTGSTWKIYTTGINEGINNARVFTPCDEEEDSDGYVTLKISEPYYEKPLFGKKISHSPNGEEYEVIVTCDYEISGDELIKMIEQYALFIDNTMNSAEQSSAWNLEIISHNIPETVPPKTQIKMIRIK